MQNVTQHTCTLRLELALSTDDFSALQASFTDALASYLGQAVTVQFVAGSVIVDLVAVMNNTQSLNDFEQRASAVTEATEMQPYSITTSSLDVQTEITQVPVDVDW